MIHVVDWIPTLISAVKDKLRPKEKDVVENFSANGMDGIDQWNTLVNRQTSNRKEFLYNIDLLFSDPGHPNNDKEIGQAALR